MWISASIWVIVSCGSCLALFNRGLDAFRMSFETDENGVEKEVWEKLQHNSSNSCNNNTVCFCSWKQEFLVRYSKFRLTIGITSLFLVSFFYSSLPLIIFSKKICLTYVWILCKECFMSDEKTSLAKSFFFEFKLKLKQLKICSVSQSQPLNSSGSHARNLSKMT